MAVLAIVASTAVVLSRNPVHSVLSLILVFCFSSMVLISLTADFLALLFIVVYVGAIAVLFLFVIMMLNIKIVQISESNIRWLPLGFFIFAILSAEVFMVISPVFSATLILDASFLQAWVEHVSGADLLVFLGSTLYSYLFYSFLLSSFVLLVALVGAIMLTVGVRRVSRRQLISKQVSRDVFSSIVFYK